jgi:hypothetical protein
LRPLTLLYGLNNGGKSSLVRSLPLLADSLGHEGLDALNLEGRLKPFDLDFDSLRWKGRAETDEHTIGLGLRWEDDQGRCDVEWALREVEEWHRLVVDRFAVSWPGHQPDLLAEWRMLKEQEAERALTYAVHYDGNESRDLIGFRGLLPSAETWPLSGWLEKVRSRLDAFAGSVLWLHSLRPAPQRSTRWRGAVRWSMEPDGHDAPIQLAGEPALQAEVSSWYARHLGFDLVVEESRKREVRTLLRNRERVSFDVDLVDTGEGVSECLPVLTALAMARHHRERGGPSIIAIEEPGSHLHPDLQRALAERVCEVAATARPRIVLETHSEHVLLTARLHVVKGLLRPEDVVFYWVKQLSDGRSVAERVVLDEQGRFQGNWPPGAFQQDIELAAEIQDERERRREE